MQSSSGQGEQNSFIEGKRKLGKGGIQYTESVTFHWLSPCQERRVLLPPFGLALQGLGAPYPGLLTLI